MDLRTQCGAKKMRSAFRRDTIEKSIIFHTLCFNGQKYEVKCILHGEQFGQKYMFITLIINQQMQ